MENRSLVTIAEHSKEKIMYLLEMAREFEKKPNRRLLAEKVVATLFFEPSTRTRLSFETAANRLGARVIGFTDPKVTSSSKGETLKDTIMMVSNYADIIVMRHYLEGAARYASEVAPVPIVNAGDGANQHPSQTMLDLYSIYAAMQEFGINDHKIIERWERIYLEEGPEGLAIERRGRSSKGRPPKQLPKQMEEDLLAEVQRLRAENDYLKNLQALVLEDERRQRRKRR